MKIAMLLSGGVDSSVALALLKDQGHDLTAFYLKIWLADELAYLGSCPWQEDLAFAEKVCAKLNVPLQVINMQKEYWDSIVAYTISEVKSGRTPSPDIFCNKRIKFGVFLDKFGNQFDKIATGHYAKIEETETNTQFILKKSTDLFKDQTYFLSHLNQNQLSKILFPIGDLLKSQVREIATKYDLANSNRKDSQGICFLGKIKFSDFIKHHLGTKSGDFIEFESKKPLGKHEGFWYYTIGQRKGIGLGGGPWYVVDKDCKNNIIYISNKYFDEDKTRDKLTVSDFNWISGTPPSNTNLTVKIRHGQDVYSCSLNFLNNNKDSAIITLDRQDQGLAQGQFAVFYDQDICLGCGVIS